MSTVSRILAVLSLLAGLTCKAQVNVYQSSDPYGDLARELQTPPNTIYQDALLRGEYAQPTPKPRPEVRCDNFGGIVMCQ